MSRFGTGFIASGRPPRAKGDGGDGGAETSTAEREEHEPKEVADYPEPPGEPSESPVCDEVQTATTGATVAQAIGGQGEAEACETPLPWEEEYNGDMTTEEDDRLDWEVGQHLWGSDWEDDEDFLDSQPPYSGREHGDDADSGWRAGAQAAACGATRVMATMSAARAQEEAAYLDMWGDMRARAAQETPAHKEAAQAAETVGTATPSQTGQDVPTAKEEKLIVGGASASTTATTADEERRAVRKVAYLTLVADTEARRRARLTDMKQWLPSLAAQLRRLRQDVGCTERPAPTKVHLRATATVDEQLKKAKMLLRLMEANLEPVEGHLMEAGPT